MRLFRFENWISLHESVEAFDPDARYSDSTFGYAVGGIDSAKASSGGTGGNWGGSMSRALWFAKVADEWGLANGKLGGNRQSLVTSQKRSRVLTASGNMSDHFKGNEDAYAVDISANGAEGDALLAYIMAKFGHPEYKGGSWFNVTKNGYRYQVGWRVKNHFDHIHVGVKKTGAKGSSTPSVSVPTVIAGATFGEKLYNNPAVKKWFAEHLSNTELSAEDLDSLIERSPEQKDWFMKRFGLNDSGDPIGVGVASQDDTKMAVDAALSSKKIKSNYTGEKAKNIDLLVNEIEAAGVTNKYAIIGILSTIGKESAFVPKNEIPYTNTDNRRIRKIFGSRVAKLSDEELTKLKSNPTKFWDRVYGSDDPTGRSQQYGNTQPGDGEKYLGRGFNGITFKSGYEKYGRIVGMDLVSNPEKLNDPQVAAKAAVAFLLNGLKTKGIEPNSFTNKKEAVHAFVQVNAGLGTNIEGSETLANAEKVSNNFELA